MTRMMQLLNQGYNKILKFMYLYVQNFREIKHIKEI